MLGWLMSQAQPKELAPRSGVYGRARPQCRDPAPTLLPLGQKAREFGEILSSFINYHCLLFLCLPVCWFFPFGFL